MITTYKILGIKVLEVETQDEKPFEKTIKEKVFGTKGAVLDISPEELKEDYARQKI